MTLIWPLLRPQQPLIHRTLTQPLLLEMAAWMAMDSSKTSSASSGSSNISKMSRIVYNLFGNLAEGGGGAWEAGERLLSFAHRSLSSCSSTLERFVTVDFPQLTIGRQATLVLVSIINSTDSNSGCHVVGSNSDVMMEGILYVTFVLIIDPLSLSLSLSISSISTRVP